MLKEAKDLKKGDIVQSTASDGRISYLAWCTVLDRRESVMYDAGNPKYKANSGRVDVQIITISPRHGKLKGDKYTALLFPDDAIKIPDQPSKIRRIWNAFMSE